MFAAGLLYMVTLPGLLLWCHVNDAMPHILLSMQRMDALMFTCCIDGMTSCGTEANGCN